LLNISKKWIIALRVVVAIIAYGFIALKLYQQGFIGITAAIEEIRFAEDWALLLATLIFMPVAWGFEAIKWQFAMKSVERITFAEAWQSVWYGVVAGMLTPNRVGEPIGRIAFVEHQNRGKAVLLAIWCGVSQQIATLTFGVIGLTYWFLKMNADDFSQSINSIFVLILIIAIVMSITIVVGIGKISEAIQRIGFVRKFLSGEILTLSITKPTTITILLLSLLRYSIFSTQLVMLFIFFGINVPVINIYVAVFLTYLFASVIPSFAIGEAGVRSGFAITFFGTMAPNSAGIIAAILTLWILNIGFPALVAVWFPWLTKRSYLKAK
jgi:hypothetical protein